MIVTLSDADENGLGFLAARYPFWDAISDMLSPLEDEDGEYTGEWVVSADSSDAQAVMDAAEEEFDSGHDPLSGAAGNLVVVGSQVYDHADHGLNYGFSAKDRAEWEAEQ